MHSKLYDSWRDELWTLRSSARVPYRIASSATGRWALGVTYASEAGGGESVLIDLNSGRVRLIARDQLSSLRWTASTVASFARELPARRGDIDIEWYEVDAERLTITAVRIEPRRFAPTEQQFLLPEPARPGSGLPGATSAVLRGQEISLRNEKTGATFLVATGVRQVSIAPNARLVVAQMSGGEYGEYVAFDLVSGDRHDLGTLDAAPMGWSPQGRYVVLAKRGPRLGEYATTVLDFGVGLASVRVLGPYPNLSIELWHPSGDWAIALTEYCIRPGGFNLGRFDPPTGTIARLATGLHGFLWPRWVPGQELIYVTVRGSGRGLPPVLVDPSTGSWWAPIGLSALNRPQTPHYLGGWSEDGRWVTAAPVPGKENDHCPL